MRHACRKFGAVAAAARRLGCRCCCWWWSAAVVMAVVLSLVRGLPAWQSTTLGFCV